MKAVIQVDRPLRHPFPHRSGVVRETSRDDRCGRSRCRWTKGKTLQHGKRRSLPSTGITNEWGFELPQSRTKRRMNWIGYSCANSPAVILLSSRPGAIAVIGHDGHHSRAGG